MQFSVLDLTIDRPICLYCHHRHHHRHHRHHRHHHHHHHQQQQQQQQQDDEEKEEQRVNAALIAAILEHLTAPSLSVCVALQNSTAILFQPLG